MAQTKTKIFSFFCSGSTCASSAFADSSDAFNCRLESTDLNTDEDESTYVVQWVWKCQHLGNVG